MSRPNGVKIKLRSGVKEASLPDGRSLRPGQTKTITWEDFQLISPGARKSVIQIDTIVNTPTTRTSIDVTAIDPSPAYKLGQVEEGVVRGDLFRYVKFVDEALLPGSVVCWGTDPNTVTGKRASGTAKLPLTFAGIVMAEADPTEFGWIQVDGVATGVIVDGASALDEVEVDSTESGTASKISGSVESNTYVGTVITAPDSEDFGDPKDPTSVEIATVALRTNPETKSRYARDRFRRGQGWPRS